MCCISVACNTDFQGQVAWETDIYITVSCHLNHQKYLSITYIRNVMSYTTIHLVRLNNTSSRYTVDVDEGMCNYSSYYWYATRYYHAEIQLWNVISSNNAMTHQLYPSLPMSVQWIIDETKLDAHSRGLESYIIKYYDLFSKAYSSAAHIWQGQGSVMWSRQMGLAEAVLVGSCNTQCGRS